MTPDAQEQHLFAQFVNGRDARWQRVELHVTPTALRITRPDGARIEWPFDSLRRAPDQAGRDGIVLSQAGDKLARLVLKGKGPAEQIAGLAPNLTQRPPFENLGRLLKWSAAALASVAVIIFFLVPVMANQLAEFLPPEGEKALGDTTFEQIRVALDQTGLDPVQVCDRPEGAAALAKMEVRLNPYSDLPYPIRVQVLDHPMVNAFALPGGRVILFKGLIHAAEAPEELAAVLAHEIGHVVARDPTRDALRSAGSIGVLGLLFGDFAGGTVVLFLANQLINASYSQDAETGADTYAHALLEQAGLPPSALGTMFQRLKDKHGDAEGIIAHFASHPQLEDRISAALAADTGEAPERPVLDSDEWEALRQICGEAPARIPEPTRDIPPLKEPKAPDVVPSVKKG
ncbi:M48 family metallopeptidase [Aliiroseovarius subalbicans]|uniref:M48 family metallopeptidase n=1 Tax=Aliiroseovarius subalbicans TaxID=2925840 RepID=UPI001F599E56|nr:M48 family metallopeptidase [Aliiroseovarius subalbicans]MCI2399694.1 M48 family metallopeptidase [Aliiroseovarius subalbicans]